MTEWREQSTRSHHMLIILRDTDCPHIVRLIGWTLQCFGLQQRTSRLILPADSPAEAVLALGPSEKFTGRDFAPSRFQTGNFLERHAGSALRAADLSV